MFFIVAVVLTCSANGQTCTCESNFEWVKKTFEENDAGFQYIIDKKGLAAYNIHNQLMLEKMKTAKTSTECTGLLYEWLTFFRSGHIGIVRLANETSTKKTETWKGNVSQFEKYVSEKSKADYEGIWDINGVLKIGIQKQGTNYVGFIIESSADTWKPEMVILKIEQNDGKVKSTLYRRDYTPIESDEPELIGNNYLRIGQQVLKRLKPHFTSDIIIENYFKSINSPSPFLEELNATTLYLRIPSFDSEDKSSIDKVLIENKEKILKTENLIIDLRNNSGGADQSFRGLLPFLYTNPIRSIAAEFLSTPQNNQQFLDFSTNPELDEGTRKLIKNIYDKLQERPGEFVNPFGEGVSVIRQDVVYEYPKKVGIIINEENASTTEEFLLAAKQSKKVKLFGVTTSGALDVSNMASVESPCKEFILRYCLSRSLRIPGMTIDDIGLQPDFYLDKTIPQHKWVEFVNEILNQ